MPKRTSNTVPRDIPVLNPSTTERMLDQQCLISKIAHLTVCESISQTTNSHVATQISSASNELFDIPVEPIDAYHAKDTSSNQDDRHSRIMYAEIDVDAIEHDANEWTIDQNYSKNVDPIDDINKHQAELDRRIAASCGTTDDDSFSYYTPNANNHYVLSEYGIHTTTLNRHKTMALEDDDNYVGTNVISTRKLRDNEHIVINIRKDEMHDTGMNDIHMTTWLVSAIAQTTVSGIESVFARMYSTCSTLIFYAIFVLESDFSINTLVSMYITSIRNDTDNTGAIVCDIKNELVVSNRTGSKAYYWHTNEQFSREKVRVHHHLTSVVERQFNHDIETEVYNGQEIFELSNDDYEFDHQTQGDDKLLHPAYLSVKDYYNVCQDHVVNFTRFIFPGTVSYTQAIMPTFSVSTYLNDLVMHHGPIPRAPSSIIPDDIIDVVIECIYGSNFCIEACEKAVIACLDFELPQRDTQFDNLTDNHSSILRRIAEHINLILHEQRIKNRNLMVKFFLSNKLVATFSVDIPLTTTDKRWNMTSMIPLFNVKDIYVDRNPINTNGDMIRFKLQKYDYTKADASYRAYKTYTPPTRVLYILYHSIREFDAFIISSRVSISLYERFHPVDLHMCAVTSIRDSITPEEAIFNVLRNSYQGIPLNTLSLIENHYLILSHGNESSYINAYGLEPYLRSAIHSTITRYQKIFSQDRSASAFVFDTSCSTYARFTTPSLKLTGAITLAKHEQQPPIYPPGAISYVGFYRLGFNYNAVDDTYDPTIMKPTFLYGNGRVLTPFNHFLNYWFSYAMSNVSTNGLRGRHYKVKEYNTRVMLIDYQIQQAMAINDYIEHFQDTIIRNSDYLSVNLSYITILPP